MNQTASDHLLPSITAFQEHKDKSSPRKKKTQSASGNRFARAVHTVSTVGKKGKPAGIPFRTRADSFPSSPVKEVLLPQRGIPTQQGPCFHAVRIHFLLFFCIIIRFSGPVFLRLFPKSVHVCQPNIPFSAFYVGTKDVFLSFSHHCSIENRKYKISF